MGAANPDAPPASTAPTSAGTVVRQSQERNQPEVSLFFVETCSIRRVMPRMRRKFDAEFRDGAVRIVKGWSQAARSVSAADDAWKYKWIRPPSARVEYVSPRQSRLARGPASHADARGGAKVMVPWCSLECTPACQAGGRGFKSRRDRTTEHGRVAQLAERPPEKRKVTGSTPVPTTTHPPTARSEAQPRSGPYPLRSPTVRGFRSWGRESRQAWSGRPSW